MAVRYRNPKGLRAELVLNWEGMYSEYSREKFRIFGAIHKDWSREADKRWYVGGGLSMFHFANSALTEGNVVDNMLANPYVRTFAEQGGRGGASQRRRSADGRTAFPARLSRRVPAGSAARPHSRRRGVEDPHGPPNGAVRLGWQRLEFENNLYVRPESHAALRAAHGSELYAGERRHGTRAPHL